MADHWVSELFPPTFEFSIKDLLCKTPQSENQQKLFSKDDESKAKYDLYERVYQEMDEKIPHQQPSDASDLYEDGKHFEDVVHIPKSKKHDGKRGHKSKERWNEKTFKRGRRLYLEQKRTLDVAKIFPENQTAEYSTCSHVTKFGVPSEGNGKKSLSCRPNQQKYWKKNYSRLRDNIKL